MENENASGSPRAKRKLKKLYAKIRKQMEFYFSDSNLAKDKFLSKLISEDPEGFVDIEIFKTFNKIKTLTDSTEVIVSAVSRSKLFQLNEDHTKLKRATSLELSKDFDACTLYVEKLPPTADHKWIRDVFGHFGTVRYVNVPRYKITNRIKGFAFVEFEEPESVQKACEFYKLANQKECSTSEDEGKQVKNAKKHKSEDVSERKSKRCRVRSASESSEKVCDVLPSTTDHPHDSSEKSLSSTDDHHLPKSKKKRKRNDSESEAFVKKLKESAAIDEQVPVKSENEIVNKEHDKDKVSFAKEEKLRNEENLEVQKSDSEQNMDTGGKKKRRKKSKKHHSNIDKSILRVMSKTEWKSYRNKYLELQRATMALIKKQILLETHELKQQQSHTKTIDNSENKKSLQFQPGVIIKIELNNPVKNPTEIKNEIKTNAVVAYVDAQEQSSEIFIRFHTSDEAQHIIKEEKLRHLGKVELLKDTDEKKYWEKIENDRKLKFSNPVPHKKRGRDKLLAKAAKLEEMKNKHVYFDE